MGIFPPMIIDPDKMENPVFIYTVSHIFRRLLLFARSLFLYFLQIRPDIQTNYFIPIRDKKLPMVFRCIRSEMNEPPVSGDRNFILFIAADHSSLIIGRSQEFCKAVIIFQLFHYGKPPCPFTVFQIIISAPQYFCVFFSNRNRRL